MDGFQIVGPSREDTHNGVAYSAVVLSKTPEYMVLNPRALKDLAAREVEDLQPSQLVDGTDQVSERRSSGDEREIQACEVVAFRQRR